MRRRTPVGAALLAAFAAAALLADPAATSRAGEPAPVVTTAEPTPDAAFQQAIRAVARAEDPAALRRALAELRALSAPDFSDLVPQLALFLLSADGEREGMTPAVIVDRLGIAPEQIERATERHRETANPALRSQLENLRGADE